MKNNLKIEKGLDRQQDSINDVGGRLSKQYKDTPAGHG